MSDFYQTLVVQAFFQLRIGISQYSFGDELIRLLLFYGECIPLVLLKAVQEEGFAPVFYCKQCTSATAFTTAWERYSLLVQETTQIGIY